MKNVLAQKILVLIDIASGTGIASTTFFASRCEFAKPAPGEVDVKTSIPLSRFVKGMVMFKVDFAVGGANTKSSVVFNVNGQVQCAWLGIKLDFNASSFCVDLVKDEMEDLRIFHGIFPVKTNVSNEAFSFQGGGTYVVVSIDYKQDGISPEVADCNREPFNQPCILVNFNNLA
eukprot:TsM_000387400 transcript=TsM_000387400 gene=TsM_000387400